MNSNPTLSSTSSNSSLSSSSSSSSLCVVPSPMRGRSVSDSAINKGTADEKPQHIKHQKSVSFGTIESIAHEVIRGHPDFEVANPVSLGWRRVKKTKVVSVDEYEKSRSMRRRSSTGSMMTSAKEREMMIKKSERRVHQITLLENTLWLLIPKRAR